MKIVLLSLSIFGAIASASADVIVSNGSTKPSTIAVKKISDQMTDYTFSGKILYIRQVNPQDGIRDINIRAEDGWRQIFRVRAVC